MQLYILHALEISIIIKKCIKKLYCEKNMNNTKLISCY